MESQYLSNYLRFYYHLAICVFFLTANTYSSMAVGIQWQYCIWVSLVTFLVYNYHPLVNLSVDEFKKTFNSYFPIYFLIGTSGLAGFFLINNHFSKILSFGTALLLTVIYFKTNSMYSQAGRDHFVLKPVLIGVVYTIITFIIPSHSAGLSLMEMAVLSIGKLTFIMALSLIFDICDMRENLYTHYPTLPEKIGIKRTKHIVYLLLLVSALIEFFGVISFLIEIKSSVAMMITIFLSALITFFAKQNSPNWYSLFLTDSMMLLPYLLSVSL